MSVTRSVVTGVGSYLPEQVVTNADLAKIVDTSDEWIQERTGIKQRHKARDDQPTSDLAVEAARKALADARIPRAPGRFTLVDPAAPGGFGLEGPTTRAPAGWLRPVRAAVCDGASWRADVAPRRPGRIEQRYTLCLFPYRDGRRQGHQLDIYAATVFHGGQGAVAPPLDAETPETFMRGAVQAIEHLTRVRGVWIEHRKADRDRPFTQGDDALSAQTQ